MEITADQEALFQTVFEYPTDDFLRRLTQIEYPLFIYYLFKRDGLYRPILTEGTGDGGVDIELHARESIESLLVGVVQCKRYLMDPIRPADVARLIVAAQAANAPRRYFFTTSTYAPVTRREARNQNTHLYENDDVRFWIADIKRRESLKLVNPLHITNSTNMPIPVICVTNNKGGVGKTTITGNLAAQLATGQHGVLVIDAAPEGHLTFWLTNRRREEIPSALSLHAVLTRQTPIYPLIQPTLVNNVWILPSSREMNDLPGGYQAWTLERSLAHALIQLPLFDPPIRYIIIDTPPTLNSMTRAALLAATSLIIPLQLDVFSLEGLNELLQFVELTEHSHSKQPIQILGAVATRVDLRFRWGFRYWEQPKLEDRPRLSSAGLVGERFWIGMLRQRVDFPKSQADHQAVMTFAPGSDASKDIVQLAREVTARVSTPFNPD